MNKKTTNIIGVIFIFLIGFILHNLYEWFPNFITTIFAPVSESIFEHIKLMLTSYMLWIIIKYFIFKKYEIKENNFLFKELLTVIFEIVLFLAIFVPSYNKFGENLMITLLIYFISISLGQILNYFITFKKDYKVFNILSFIAIIIIYVITTYLTYKPPITDFFLDPTNNSYGLNK